MNDAAQLRGIDLFAGLRVSDLDVAVDQYSRLLGSEPAFRPNDREAVWELAEHRYLYVEAFPDGAGGGLVTVFVEDFDERIAAIAGRGLEPALVETYENGVRKHTFRDADGNEVGFGGAPRVAGDA